MFTRINNDTGEPDALKEARPVRRREVGKVQIRNSSAPYPTFIEGESLCKGAVKVALPHAANGVRAGAASAHPAAKYVSSVTIMFVKLTIKMLTAL